MRRRLRKKLRKGEFTVRMIPIAFRMRELSTSDQNDLLDRFCEEAIEENELQFGGGGGGHSCCGYAEPIAFPGLISADQRSAVDSWLTSESDILESFVGEVMTDDEVEMLMTHEPDFPRSRLGSASSANAPVGRRSSPCCKHGAITACGGKRP